VSRDPRREAAPSRQPQVAAPASAEEVAAVLAAVEAWAEEEATAGPGPEPAVPPAWAAARRVERPAQLGSGRRAVPRRGESG